MRVKWHKHGGAEKNLLGIGHLAELVKGDRVSGGVGGFCNESHLGWYAPPSPPFWAFMNEDKGK